jgi:hypothetical protein
MAANLTAELDAMADWMDSGSAADMVAAWQAKLKTTVIDMTVALQLKSCVQAKGFGQFGQSLLESVEAAVVLSLQQTSPQNRAPLKAQHLLRPENFLTLSEWDRLQHGSPGDRLQTLLRRYLLLGVRSLSEQTVKNGIALLLSVSSTSAMPSYQEIFHQVGVFKRTFDEQKTRWPMRTLGTQLTQFPETAQELEGDLFAAAYPSPEDAPMDRRRTCQKDVWLAHVPLRATSALLKGASAPQTAPVETGSQQNTIAALVQALLPGTSRQQLAEALALTDPKVPKAEVPQTLHLRTPSHLPLTN